MSVEAVGGYVWGYWNGDIKAWNASAIGKSDAERREDFSVETPVKNKLSKIALVKQFT